MRLRWIMIVACVLLLSAACSTQHSEQTDHAAEATHGTAITWYDGGVDEAFALAAQEDKPLFLYWGAVWCPPCQFLKTTIFSRPEFVEKSNEFVTVYLDGDTERAQIYGERFDVMGYPTVIIFSPEGEEIMRMPTDVEPDQYALLLDAALESMRPVKDILASVMKTGAATADVTDLNLLAFYSWGQDAKVELPEEEVFDTFQLLYEQTPAKFATEKSRFFTLFLEAAIERAESDADEPVLTTDQIERYYAELIALFDNSELLANNLSFLFYYPTETIDLLHPEPSEERDLLIDKWQQTARAVEEVEDYSVSNRLSAMLPGIWLASTPSDTEDAEIPEEIQQHVRERVAWAVETVTDEHELQAVMNTIGWVLEEAGLESEFETLLQEKMDDTLAPYYYMSWIAGIKKDADQKDEAVVWYRKAYDNAEGRYTRFRWGSTYLRRLMELTPEDAAGVEAGSFEILKELLVADDAFALGNYMRLKQLDSAYGEWNESGEHDELLERIRDLVHAECNRYPTGDENSQQSRCTAFMIPEQA
jgi:thioredoxin-related protein